jgi:hypothetical protein
MRHPILAILSLSVIGWLVGGCGPSPEVSGWELVPKTNRVVQMENFPDIPVYLPDTPAAPQPPVLTGTIYGLYSQKLDEGSLFRRGYSAPTP